tara:strand:+ start:161 stop:439 length:279 start_codon:yes stop_codon:yes gene_type:complete
MAITKEIKADKIEVMEIGRIQIRTATIIKEDGNEITRTFHRHAIDPSDKSSGSWQDTDISNEDERVQAIANATWTDAVKKEYQDMVDSIETP